MQEIQIFSIIFEDVCLHDDLRQNNNMIPPANRMSHQQIYSQAFCKEDIMQARVL